MQREQIAFEMQREQIALATKTGSSLLSPFERRVAARVVPRIPLWLGTHHLTVMTLAWCAGLVVCGHLAARDLRWLWASSLMILLQYVTDFFDGKVGKYRNTGLVKWGFYTDHLLDYVFLCALVGSYAFILPASSHVYLFLVLAVFGGFMVNSFLAFAATGHFRISHLKLGPTEFRLALVALNSLVVFYGTRRMAKALPYVAAGGFVLLCVLVYRTQRELWRRDMEDKRHAERARSLPLARREAA
ncbi:MAG: CDP-diacylglycerol---glycerol-3-phosphate 3-phosphatidyltransferase [Acidobacteriota bacterium]|jgi:phosphatidylglycerophosphate synthase|nr:CDP-diacylglycerol---glycerol-3-phosphate 3-phosphatidyltransferase [Acidobacteriota bacterium]